MNDRGGLTTRDDVQPVRRRTQQIGKEDHNFIFFDPGNHSGSGLPGS